MQKNFIPFSKPDIGESEIEAVVAVLRSGWLTTGRQCRDFEHAFEVKFGDSAQAIAVNSATAGLHLAMEAIGVGPGDEVIVPTMTFTATAEVVRYMGGTPRLVDIDPVTLNLCPNSVRQAINPNTKAIVPVHYGGLPCDMTTIFNLASEHGLRVVEDAAHALPAAHRGRAIGSLQSDVVVFSFYANKTMTTGEGGMVITRDIELAKRMRVMRLHGIDRDAFDRFRSVTPAWYYEIVAPGFKYNLTDIAAAIGIVQLMRLDEFAGRRLELTRNYDRLLANLPLIFPSHGQETDKHAWHLYVIRLNDDAHKRGFSRDGLIDHLSDNGIGTSVHYVPLHRHPYWSATLQVSSDQFPAAELAYERMLSIPLFSAMSDTDQLRVAESIRRYFD